ncbi:MAG: helix-turn-helix domain-containing protein [Thermoproteota archaeon]
MINYKFRLYLTKEQEVVLGQTLDGCRWLCTTTFCQSSHRC